MYCSKCDCSFEGWKDKCPTDGTILLATSPIPEKPTHQSVSYETLVDMIRANNGSFELELHTSEVVCERKMSFPYRGHGYAWAKKMMGEIEGIAVELHIEEVGMKKDYGFPYQGYGFAWEKQMSGWVGGNEVKLSVKSVASEKKHLFPYRGHGYSWAKEMTGTCGRLVRVDLKTTEIGRDRNWFLFYFGFGYAWMKQATLTLSLTD